MNHIKDNWIVGEVFQASDLNNIARTLNSMIDKQESLINDEAESDSSAFSSEKIEEMAAETISAVIDDDNEGSGDTTFSSSKTTEEIENAKFKTVFVDELPLTGEENTMYFKLRKSEYENRYIMNMKLSLKNGKVSLDMDDVSDELCAMTIGNVFKYTESAGTEYPTCLISNIDKDNLSLTLEANDFGPGMDIISEFAGVTAITPQDGHYYILKDKLFLTGNQINGNVGCLYSIEGQGFEIYVFEEISNPGHVDYEDIPFIPGISIVAFHTRYDYSKVAWALYQGDGGYIDDETKAFKLPDLKVGQIVKVTGENTGHNGHDYLVITEAEETPVSDWEDSIISTSVWRKNEYYRFTGYHTIYQRGSGYIDFIVQTVSFEKINNVEAADYELSCMPGVLYVNCPIVEKYMCVDGEFELISSQRRWIV